MSINEFVEKFAEAVNIDDASTLTPETSFRDLDEWGSIAHLCVLALLDEEFGIQIELSDFQSINTIKELYDKAVSMQQ